MARFTGDRKNNSEMHVTAYILVVIVRFGFIKLLKWQSGYVVGAEEQIVSEQQQLGGGSVSEEEAIATALVQASGKMVLIDKLLPKLRQDQHKVLVFSQMVRCLDLLEEYLVNQKYVFLV